MTVADLFALFRDVVMAIIGVLVFFWGRDRKQVADAIELRFSGIEKQLEARHETTTIRLDEAGHHSSKLASVVQGVIGRLDRLPDDLRSKFLPLDRAGDLIDDSKRDRRELWEAVKDLQKRSG